MGGECGWIGGSGGEGSWGNKNAQFGVRLNFTWDGQAGLGHPPWEGGVTTSEGLQKGG